MIDYKSIAIDAIRNLAISQDRQELAQLDRDATIRVRDEIDREEKLHEAREGNAL